MLNLGANILVLQLGAGMKRRVKMSGKVSSGRPRKAKSPKRQAAPATARDKSSSNTDLKEQVAQRTGELVVDEAQDLAPAELRFFAALAPDSPNGLFLSGDIGQRIFQHPYSWASLGVDVRGRSHTLKVCYRTSQQIRRAADRLLPTVLRDSDGIEDERCGIVSVFDGPSPEGQIIFRHCRRGGICPGGDVDLAQ